MTVPGTWFFIVDGSQQGPVLQATLMSGLEDGCIPWESLVWTPGMPEWAPASTIPALSAPQYVSTEKQDDLSRRVSRGPDFHGAAAAVCLGITLGLSIGVAKNLAVGASIGAVIIYAAPIAVSSIAGLAFLRAWLSSTWAAGRHGRDIYERSARSGSSITPYRLLPLIPRWFVVVGYTVVVIDLAIFLRGPVFWVAVVAATALALILIRKPTSLARWSPAQFMAELTSAEHLPPGAAPLATHALYAASMAVGLEFPPALRVMPLQVVNAWITGPRGGEAVAVTRGMLEGFGSRELEAVFSDLLVRADDPLVNSWDVLGIPIASDEPIQMAGAMFSEGSRAIAFYSAADDAAMAVLRDPSALIDALQRTRAAKSVWIPGIEPRHAATLWAWPGPWSASDLCDVQAERIKALRALAEYEVEQALTEAPATT